MTNCQQRVMMVMVTNCQQRVMMVMVTNCQQRVMCGPNRALDAPVAALDMQPVVDYDDDDDDD